MVVEEQVATDWKKKLREPKNSSSGPRNFLDAIFRRLGIVNSE